MREVNGKAQAGKAAALSQERVEQILAAYGVRPERWPKQEREAVLAAMEASAEVRARMEQHRALDHLLDEVATLEPSAELQRRIIAAAPTRKRSWASSIDSWAESLWPARRSWLLGGALAAAAALGVATGLLVPETDLDQGETDVAAVAFDDYAALGEVP